MEGTQLDLFSPRSRRSDPHTSHMAGESVTIRATSQKREILKAYANATGLTDDEAGVITGLAFRPGCCYWKRCSELRQAGLIQPTSMTRVSRAGELQQVCVITPAGYAALDE